MPAVLNNLRENHRIYVMWD